jgi:hypothetical protein
LFLQLLDAASPLATPRCHEECGAEVTLTRLCPLAMLLIVRQKLQKPQKSTRPPRIRVPNNERALFIVESQKLIGVIQRLSVTGGSVILAKAPIPEGTLAEMTLNTVFGKVKAHVQFLHTGADGMPLAQAFRFLAMDDMSRERFSAAAEQMQRAGFSDVKEQRMRFDFAYQSFSKLGESIRRLWVAITFRGAKKMKGRELILAMTGANS